MNSKSKDFAILFDIQRICQSDILINQKISNTVKIMGEGLGFSGVFFLKANGEKVAGNWEGPLWLWKKSDEVDGIIESIRLLPWEEKCEGKAVGEINTSIQLKVFETNSTKKSIDDHLKDWRVTVSPLLIGDKFEGGLFLCEKTPYGNRRSNKSEIIHLIINEIFFWMKMLFQKPESSRENPLCDFLIHSLEGGYIKTDQKGTIKEVNDNLIKITGYSSDYFLGQKVWDCFIEAPFFKDYPNNLPEWVPGEDGESKASMRQKNNPNGIDVICNFQWMGWANEQREVFIYITLPSRAVTDKGVGLWADQSLSSDEFEFFVKGCSDLFYQYDFKENVGVFYGNDMVKMGLRTNVPISGTTIWTENIYAEDRENLKKRLNKLFSSLDRDGLSVDHRVVTIDGSTLWVNNKVRLKRDAEGAPEKLYGRFADISKRIKQKSKLKAYNLVLKSIGEAQEGLFMENISPTVYKAILKRITRITGSKLGIVGEIVYKGKNKVSLDVHASIGLMEQIRIDQEENLDQTVGLSEVLQPVLEGTLEIQNNASDINLLIGGGQNSVNKWMGIPLTYHGHVYGFLFFANKENPYSEKDFNRLKPILESYVNLIRSSHFIKELKKTVKDLYQSVELYSTLARNVQDVICLHGKDNKIRYISPSVKDMLGLESSELVGEPIMRMLGDHVDFKDLALGQEGRFIVSTNHHKTRKSVYLEVLLKASKFQTERVFLSSIREISEKVKTERKLRKLVSQEKELNQLKSKVFSMASHELRSPLAIIMMCTELAADSVEGIQDKALKAEFEEQILNINSQVNRLKDVLDDMIVLDGNKEETKETSMFSFKEFFQELISNNFTKKKVPLVDLFVDEDLVVQSDKIWMTHIFKNLIENAIKFSPANANKPFVKLLVENNWINIEVKDYGFGIRPEEVESVFNPFFRGGNSRGISGSGLGLSIVREYVDRMEGSVDFKSKVGEGSSFMIKLPLSLKV
ncbi:PAS domain S-box protein [Echinicola marina]|uniref:ATP-binding protein n=1 Tax=Echinicola marina TaxID=2859768 RepID=UPI001CF70A9D|nr:ATP-binding protein [Echinicola marina]UCS94004.1 PAS domain S-box protein [Echinicola marina]